jgi:hypothetical protein
MPVISWQPPATGTPNFYTVQFLELYVSGSRARGRSVGSIVTADMQVRVPPGLLNPSTSYVIRVMATNGSGPQFLPQSAPFYDTLTSHYASALTSLVSVP